MQLREQHRPPSALYLVCTMLGAAARPTDAAALPMAAATTGRRSAGFVRQAAMQRRCLPVVPGPRYPRGGRHGAALQSGAQQQANAPRQHAKQHRELPS